jgi:hypothetical protein
LHQKRFSHTKTAILLGLSLSIIFLACILWILIGYTPEQTSVAHIYQDGTLLQTIRLHSVTEPYSFTVIGTNNCENEIEVRPGSIGIISADCPDKLCVHQGFISTSRLPITCLPNRLVIRIEAVTDDMDIITY